MVNRITIKSIARDLGVSHMTVSRALSGHPNVHKKTRELVQERARELGYIKSAAASAMRGEATSIVGLLLPNILNEFYARFANALALQCNAYSLQLLIHLTNDDIEIEQKSMERLREVQARAVVMVPAPVDERPPVAIPAAMPIIQLIRRRATLASGATLLVDDRYAIREAVEHLAKSGHRSIAYIGADAALSSGRERLAAYREGLEVAGLPENPVLAHTDVPSFEMGRKMTTILLESTDATALVCGGFEISNGALSAIGASSAEQKEAFGFVGYGDPSYYAWINGGVSTISVPVADLASRAAELVAAASGSKQEGIATVESYPATFVARNGERWPVSGADRVTVTSARLQEKSRR